jgi:hypothetical protein
MDVDSSRKLSVGDSGLKSSLANDSNEGALQRPLRRDRWIPFAWVQDIRIAPELPSARGHAEMHVLNSMLFPSRVT